MFFTKKTQYTVIIFFAHFFLANTYSQFYNTDIEAKIEMENNNEFISITGTALNKTPINHNIRYVLSIVKTNLENNNSSKNDQSGRVVLLPSERQSLSNTTINSNDKDKIIILLLLYDLDDNIVGKDKIVLNDDGESDVEVKEKLLEKLTQKEASSPDVDNSNKDGVVLRGVVVEDTKTKPGRDFYNMFYSLYILNNINSEKMVTVKEVLAMGTNTKIEVLVDDNKIVEFFARPKNEYLKSMAESSIIRLRQYFQRLEREKEIVKRY